jgi:hypothetical protein
MTIDDRILINQLAQRTVDIETGIRWFESLAPEPVEGNSSKRAALQEICYFIAQSHPRPDEISAAIGKSGLKKSVTPCVLLAKDGDPRMHLAKIASLPDPELLRSFRLLIALLGVSDARRRREELPGRCNHWWHLDLSNEDVLRAIRRDFGP